ncbi:hypothetical protein HYC85_011294 [Camellia sinensis]|uniref:Uncharacterized protein n=1 Tax=Camellia sinensis TaxID=4442 RepID=A0A7J7HAM5_CAMSI|nr:hypothetical protein HYC85_011294 [Camellia sinensis]
MSSQDTGSVASSRRPSVVVMHNHPNRISLFPYRYLPIPTPHFQSSMLSSCRL